MLKQKSGDSHPSDCNNGDIHAEADRLGQVMGQDSLPNCRGSVTPLSAMTSLTKGKGKVVAFPAILSAMVSITVFPSHDEVASAFVSAPVDTSLTLRIRHGLDDFRRRAGTSGQVKRVSCKLGRGPCLYVPHHFAASSRSLGHLFKKEQGLEHLLETISVYLSYRVVLKSSRSMLGRAIRAIGTALATLISASLLRQTIHETTAWGRLETSDVQLARCGVGSSIMRSATRMHA